MKRVLIVLLAFLFSASWMLPVNAADQEHFPRLIDDAELLSQAEADDLLSELDRISTLHQMDVAVVTVNGLSGPYDDIMEFTDDLFDYGYGMGSDGDGILMVIDMDMREWWITTGGAAIRAFTDYGLELLEDAFLPYLSSGSYYMAFSVFASECDDMIRQAENGTPVDFIGYDDPGSGYRPDNPYRTPQPVSQERLSFSILIGMIAALITVLIMKGKLRSVSRAADASVYTVPGSFHADVSHDKFLYKNLSKTPRQQSSSSSGRGGSYHSGGSSTHHSSSGRSHGGRGGRF